MDLISEGFFIFIARTLVRGNLNQLIVDVLTNEYQHFINTPSNRKSRNTLIPLYCKNQCKGGI